MSSMNDTIDLETLNNETDGEYVIHNINKSIHPVHVTFRRLVNQYADDLSIDASSAAIALMKTLQNDFPKVILVKRIKAVGVEGGYMYKKYARMDAISKVSHVISTKRFNNRKRGHSGVGVGAVGVIPTTHSVNVYNVNVNSMNREQPSCNINSDSVGQERSNDHKTAVKKAKTVSDEHITTTITSTMPPVTLPVITGASDQSLNVQQVNIPDLGLVGIPVVNDTELPQDIDSTPDNVVINIGKTDEGGGGGEAEEETTTAVPESSNACSV